MTAPDPGLPNQGGVRDLLRIGGAIALGLGIVLTAIALIDFLSAFGSFGTPTNFGLAFIGLPLIAVGGWALQAGYIGPATRYVAGEVTPPLRDTLGALGLTDAATVCPACGVQNARGARFCDSCGAALARTCPACGAQNDADARFCDGCGSALTPGATPSG